MRKLVTKLHLVLLRPLSTSCTMQTISRGRLLDYEFTQKDFGTFSISPEDLLDFSFDAVSKVILPKQGWLKMK